MFTFATFPEAWATSYLQVLSSLLIFVVGLSALLFQLTVPAYLRVLMQTRFWWIVSVGIFLLCLLPLVLLCISIQPIESRLANLLSPKFDISVTFTPLFLLALFGSIIYAIYQLTLIDGTRFVKGLGTNCIKKILSGRNAYIELYSLTDIGKQSNPGFEKERVLNVIEDLTTAILDKFKQYDGTLLKPVLESLYEILVDGSMMASRSNCEQGVKILSNTIDKLHADPRFNESSDLASAVRIAGQLIVYTLNDKYYRPIHLELLEIISTISNHSYYDTSYSVFHEVGIKALECSEFLVAIKVLNYLVPPSGSITNFCSHELLALSAHIWTLNEGGELLIRSFLKQHGKRFDGSIAERIKDSIQHNRQLNRLDTVGYLHIMSKSIIELDITQLKVEQAKAELSRNEWRGE